MSDLFNQYKGQFGNAVPAAGLFFITKYGDHAIRIEAPTIGKEFIDGIYIGSDPDGFLYYNNTSDFKQPTTYTVAQVTNPADGKLCASVTFTFTNDSGAAPFAVFLAYDPANVLGLTGFSNGYSSTTGSWNDLKLGQVTGSVTKTSTGTQITVTTDVIGKTAVIHNVASAFTGDTNPVNSRGTFSFKSIDNISQGAVASYNKDRLVFYTDINATDFVAYYIPFEGSNAGEIEENSLGNANTQFTDISWN
ncbi:hypothetical protein BKA70DRAFT_115021 [Coprinopsis sp. MPI-PUGE-AT-0042]|nr:hypothetical protein BKA70DRAFT_115021 [Coprinopsis sp. MPI-PUGE-AT-0042]